MAKMTGVAKSGTEVTVAKLPNCDVCVHVEHRHNPNVAAYDAKLKGGSWGYTCEEHKDWMMYPELGLGKGQRLILDTDSKS